MPTVMPPPVVDSQGRAIAPAAAARRESVTSQTKLARERAAQREMKARAALDETAIPPGASANKLMEWIGIVESEMRDLWRRFFFLFWAWIRLQRRLLLERFKPEAQN